LFALRVLRISRARPPTGTPTSPESRSEICGRESRHSRMSCTIAFLMETERLLLSEMRAGLDIDGLSFNLQTFFMGPAWQFLEDRRLDSRRGGYPMEDPADVAAVKSLPAGHAAQKARVSPEHRLPLPPAGRDRGTLKLNRQVIHTDNLYKYSVVVKRKLLAKTAERIRELRNSLKLSQAKLARRLDLTPTAVSAWEQGLNEPSESNYLKMARMCDGELSVFFATHAGIKPEEAAVFHRPPQKPEAVQRGQRSGGVSILTTPNWKGKLEEHLHYVVEVPVLGDRAAAGSPTDINDRDIEAWLLVGMENEAERAIQLARDSNNPEVVTAARRLVEELIARGHLGFKKLVS
jgi:transcriptional regulator with XRE-family HTH domain